jgi:hypothetical protein
MPSCCAFVSVWIILRITLLKYLNAFIPECDRFMLIKHEMSLLYYTDIIPRGNCIHISTFKAYFPWRHINKHQPHVTIPNINTSNRYLNLYKATHPQFKQHPMFRISGRAHGQKEYMYENYMKRKPLPTLQPEGRFLILSGVRLSPLGTAATAGLLHQPQMIDDGDCVAIGGMKICGGNRSTRRKPAPVPLCPPQITHDLTRSQTRAAWAVARPSEERFGQFQSRMMNKDLYRSSI